MNLAETKDAYASSKLAKHDFIRQMHQLHGRLFEYPALLRDTDIARIEITAEGVVTTSRHAGIRMVCNAQDQRLVPIETMNFGHYESSELELTLRLIRPGSTVLDVGGNVGWYSLNIAKFVPDVRVYTFEPIPHTFQMLLENIRLNGADNIQPHNFGFSDRAESITFYYCKDSSGSASAANIGERADAQQITCQVMTLDTFTESRGLKVDFIKCDVEGAELRVFRGARKCLADCKPVVLTEMLRKWCRKFNYHPNEILSLFGELGYECFVPRGRGLLAFERMEETTEDTNFFFLHPAAHGDLLAQVGLETSSACDNG